MSAVVMQPNPETTDLATIPAGQPGVRLLWQRCSSLLSFHSSSSFSSLLRMPVLTACLQLPRSAAMAEKCIVTILQQNWLQPRIFQR